MADADATLRGEFLALQARLNQSRQACNLMRAFSRVLKVSEAGKAPFWIVIRDGRMDVREHMDEDADFSLRIEQGGRFREVLQGKLDVSHTLASGELVTAREKVTDLILLNRIIVAGMKS